MKWSNSDISQEVILVLVSDFFWTYYNVLQLYRLFPCYKLVSRFVFMKWEWNINTNTNTKECLIYQKKGNTIYMWQKAESEVEGYESWCWEQLVPMGSPRQRCLRGHRMMLRQTGQLNDRDRCCGCWVRDRTTSSAFMIVLLHCDLFCGFFKHVCF